MTLKICKHIGHNVCLIKWIISIYSYDIFPVSHLAKLISSLIILSFKHQNPQGGLDALSKTTIYSIEGPEGIAGTTEAIIEVATKYYKELFKFESRPNINISENFFSEGEKLTDEDNLVLEDKFIEEEIRKAVFESYSDGAPGPDGISFMFYQTFWDVIKGDLVEMFDDFHKGKLDLYRVNFALIIVIPKEKDATTMNKFRPISLLNCSYKIFTKVLTSRIGKVIDHLIASNQTAFFKGRYILESVVIAHEVLHSVLSCRGQGLVLKLDYEKAYDKVNWQFLLDILEKRGFGKRWIEWTKKILFRGSVGLTINNVEGGVET
jgi:hypothetical protein